MENLVAIKPTSVWHEVFISYLAWLLQPDIYVELGVEACRTFNKVEPYAKKLIAVDINPDSEKYMVKSPKTEFLNCDSQKLVKELRNKRITIDLLFIDADHSRESVLDDFKLIFPFVKDQGVILLHDSYPETRGETNPRESGTCYQAIEELSKKAKGYELITLPVPPGLTICRKRKRQTGWQ